MKQTHDFTQQYGEFISEKVYKCGGSEPDKTKALSCFGLL